MAIYGFALKIFFIFLSFSLLLPAWFVNAKELQADSWDGAKRDNLRAVTNNNTPPERLVPNHSLPPLPSNDIGTIRRVHLPGGQKAVALTFDLCELATKTTGCDMEILNFLRSEKISATLFMGGKWMRSHSSRVRQIMTRPDLFEIGNHAWSHGNFALLDQVGIQEQVLWTQAQYELLRESVLCQFTGDVKDKVQGNKQVNALPQVPRLFRLPYGRCTPKALKSLSEMGLRVIQWDVVAESGANNSQLLVAKREAAKVVSMVRSGSILLFHANLVPKGSATLLREIVDGLRNRGFYFVKVWELLEMGRPESTMDGYFSTPGDNLHLDRKFGRDGTGLRKP